MPTGMQRTIMHTCGCGMEEESYRRCFLWTLDQVHQVKDDQESVS